MSTSVRRALYGKLAGDSTLNALLGTPAPGYTKAIYHATAPAEAIFPLVIFHKQAGRPTYALTTTPAYETDMWLIKAVDDEPTADAAEAISARLSTLLNDGVLSISGATQLYLRRETDVEYEEDSDGRKYQHVGSMFRLLYQ